MCVEKGIKKTRKRTRKTTRSAVHVHLQGKKEGKKRKKKSPFPLSIRLSPVRKVQSIRPEKRLIRMPCHARERGANLLFFFMSTCYFLSFLSVISFPPSHPLSLPPSYQSFFFFFSFVLVSPLPPLPRITSVEHRRMTRAGGGWIEESDSKEE